MSIRNSKPSTPQRTSQDTQRTVIHELRRIKSLLAQPSTGGDASAANQVLEIALLTSIESLTSAVDVNTSQTATLTQDIQTSALQSNWSFTVGNDVAYTYDINNNVTLAEYSNSGGLVFAQAFTYDVNNNVLTITTT